MNYNANLNLLKLKAAICDVSGKSGQPVKCVVIPIEENDIYASVGDDGKVKGAYLSISLFETKQESQFGDTHMVKQSHSKQWRENHDEEERRNEPILGNAKPMKTQTLQDVQSEAVSVSNVQASDKEDDLPF